MAHSNSLSLCTDHRTPMVIEPKSRSVFFSTWRHPRLHYYRSIDHDHEYSVPSNSAYCLRALPLLLWLHRNDPHERVLPLDDCTICSAVGPQHSDLHHTDRGLELVRCIDSFRYWKLARKILGQIVIKNTNLAYRDLFAKSWRAQVIPFTAAFTGIS